MNFLGGQSLVGGVGPAGPAGPQGEPGATGTAGPDGVQGVTGPAGSDGVQGATGPAGPQGAAGGTSAQIGSNLQTADAMITYAVNDAMWSTGVDYDIGDRPWKIQRTGFGDVVSCSGTGAVTVPGVITYKNDSLQILGPLSTVSALGDDCIAIGTRALIGGSGFGTVAIGRSTGSAAGAGEMCTYVGYLAGSDSTGNHNTVIGGNATTGSSVVNSIAIGFAANAQADNECVIGSNQLERIRPQGGICDLGSMNDPFNSLYLQGGVTMMSTAHAFTPPQLTTAERDLLAAAPGNLVYNTTTGAMNIHNGTGWYTLGMTAVTVPPTVVGLLDNGLTAGAVPTVAYSVRRLKNAYTGPLVEITKQTGGVATDISADTDGYISKAAADAATGSGAYRITKWYDQTGNGRHLTQTVATNCPYLTFDVNAVPSINFSDGAIPRWFTSGTVTASDWGLANSRHTMSVVAKTTAATLSGQRPIMGSIPTEIEMFGLPGGFRWWDGSISHYADVASDWTMTTNQLYCGGTRVPGIFTRINASEWVETGRSARGIGTSVMDIGRYRSSTIATDSWEGAISEVIIFSHASLDVTPADFTKLTSRIGTHFNARGTYPDIV